MLTVVPALLIAAALFGVGYCVLAFWALIQFQSSARIGLTGTFTPPVSILKPLCGLDPHGYESLRSHCIQDYPDYEIIFGVATLDDPAVATVHRLIQEFPNVKMRLVVCSSVFGMNLKVNNLLQMLPAAKHAFLVINDSDIDVPVDYLRRVIRPLENPGVGIVTCLFRGVPDWSIGSWLESMAITCDFVPGVLCAKELERGIHFAMGSTMAVHRVMLEQIGGFHALLDYLADDYEMGRRISKAGLQVVIADCVVDHYLPGYSWKDFLEHQLRWARTIRSCRPGGYAGMILTFALPWSICALAMAPSTILARLVVLMALALRLIVSVASAWFILRDRRVLRYLWLLPVRDFVSLLIWILAYTGNSITWRGNRFELSDGKLRPA